MVAMVNTNRVTQVLHLLPRRWLDALDAWSYRVALKRAEQRRMAAAARMSRVPVPIQQNHSKS